MLEHVAQANWPCFWTRVSLRLLCIFYPIYAERVVGEGEDENNEGEEERENDEDEDDGDKKTSKGTSGTPRDDRPFILPKICTVNDFLLTISAKVFNAL